MPDDRPALKLGEEGFQTFNEYNYICTVTAALYFSSNFASPGFFLTRAPIDHIIHGSLQDSVMLPTLLCPQEAR